MKEWVGKYGTGTRTAVDGTRVPVPSRPDGRASESGDVPETPEEKIARLEAENVALRVETIKLTTEREILR